MVSGPWSPGRRLLLQCLRRGAEPAEIQELLSSDLDWQQVLDEATRHQVVSLLYSALNCVTDRAMVPPAVMEWLTASYYQQAALNGQLHAELHEILLRCARAGVPALVLKGAAIAERVYGNIALRPMKDLDLLVRSNDLDATDQLLHELGYAPDETYRPAAWYRDCHHHLAPYKTLDGRAIVEVHRDILPPDAPVHVAVEDPVAMAEQEQWAKLRLIVEVADTSVRYDRSVKIPLYARAGIRELWLVDPERERIEVLRQPASGSYRSVRTHRRGGRLTIVHDCAEQWSIRKYVYLALRLARDLVDAAVPDELLDSIRPEGLDPRVVVWATTEALADEPPIPSLSSSLAQLCGSKRSWEKAALLLERAVPSTDVLARMYPASAGSKRIYLYYPIRWKDLLRRYGRSAARLLGRDDVMMNLAERENRKAALRDWLASAQ